MKRRPLTGPKMLRMGRALAVRPHSVSGLAAIGDVKPATVRRYLAVTNTYVKEWQNARTPMFAAGRGRDAVKPKPLTAAQRMAKSRANKEKT